jgi:uncharacterized peroxidase-related enzyme
MAWIRVIREEEAAERLTEVYEQVKGHRGKVANILAVHSLHPEALKAHVDLYMTIMFGSSGLARAEREMIAVVVSAANQCPYCIEHHAAALDHYWRDDEKLLRFIEDYRLIELPERLMCLLDYAHDLTVRPNKVDESAIERIRAHGYSDEDILTINLIVSYFNFVNRIAMGLGVEFSSDEITGYQY